MSQQGRVAKCHQHVDTANLTTSVLLIYVKLQGVLAKDTLVSICRIISSADATQKQVTLSAGAEKIPLSTPGVATRGAPNIHNHSEDFH